jgi:hypothetical protein
MKLQELSNVQTGMKPSEFEELINNLAVEDKLLNINGTMQAACKMFDLNVDSVVYALCLLLRVALYLGPAARHCVSHSVAPVNEAAGKHPRAFPSSSQKQRDTLCQGDYRIKSVLNEM